MSYYKNFFKPGNKFQLGGPSDKTSLVKCVQWPLPPSFPRQSHCRWLWKFLFIRLISQTTLKDPEIRRHIWFISESYKAPSKVLSLQYMLSVYWRAVILSMIFVSIYLYWKTNIYFSPSDNGELIMKTTQK